MASYTADVRWALRDGEDFARGRYSRGHVVSFDGGFILPGTASPHVVGRQWAVEEAADPEELLVAALSSCHMLSFLHVARLAGFSVTAYADKAEGALGEIAPGRQAVTRVVLRPKVTYASDPPDAAAEARLHQDAHETCFIANSVKTEVVVEPR
jgi:organic hydroperoxide reductase OsmC/OhrA